MSVTRSGIEAELLIGGAGGAPERERQTAVSPASGEELGSFPLGQAEDVERAVAAAVAAFEDWAARTVFERAEALERVLAVAEGRREEIGRLLALEQGKPFRREALPEVDEAIVFMRYAIEIAKQLEGAMPAPSSRARRILVYRAPRGVVGAIQPWNYPLGTLGGQIGPALVCGNTVVSIPAPSTTLAAYEFCRCFEEADFPAGVHNLVTGLGAVVGDALTGHPDVQVVTFAGSVPTGRRIAERAAGKAQLIELGGNGPTVVFDDADLDLVVPDAIRATYSLAGQNCLAAGRFLVMDSIYDEFAERLTASVAREVKLGDPLDEASTMGPLNNATLAEKVDRHVADAVAAGATVTLGGSRASGFPTDLYWEPTVLTGVEESMSVATEETFGPVAPLQRIASEAEALEIMRASSYGLSSAVYTRDLARGLKFAERAPAGTVGLNSSTTDIEMNVPVGGRAGKSSGIGRTQGRYPMEEVYTELKTMIVNLG
ncbi:MAG: aldehyde dehydrogenase [Actinobacteria bacterium]|nr:aldehyde dehydrogenase [Actinomycetota bacterium]